MLEGRKPQLQSIFLLVGEVSAHIEATMRAMPGEKLQRAFRYDKRITKRNRHSKHHAGRNRHHLIPRSRGGDSSCNNLLLINIEKHELWHQLWGNRTAEEILDLLERVVRAKHRQKAA